MNLRLFSPPHPASLLVLASLLATGPGLAQQGGRNVDTSEWACEFCPFEDGYRADYDVGTTVVSDDSAWFGNATGYDETGTYANVSGDASYVRDDLAVNLRLNELGLDSRAASLGVKRQGTFDAYAAYREQPWREFITTRSIFDVGPSGVLTLPQGWVRSGATGGFASLASNLAVRDIESDRNVFEAGGSYLPSSRLSLSADYRHQRRTGNNILGGSYYTVASLLPMPFVYETDEVDFKIGYATDRGSLALSWYLSDFESGGRGFTFESPFSTPAGAEFATLAQPPDNRFQQVSLSGGYRFPTMMSYMRFSASFGRIEQDTALLDYTTNANLDAGPLPRASLDGNVDTMRIAFAAGARPLPGSRIEFSASVDERDNGTPRETWSRVITDSFLSGDPELNNPFSYERTRLSLEGSYDLLSDFRLLGGVEHRQIDRDLQEVAEQDELRGWGGIRWRPSDALTIRGELGTSRRDIDRYDEALAQSFGQNPILRKYNLAYRYREFGELVADGSFADGRLGWSVNAMFYDDSYSESRLGLIAGEERAFSGELNYAMSEKSSVYLHAGFETIDSIQLGSEAVAEPDWRAENEDEFVTVGAGIRLMQVGDRFDIEIDAMSSDGSSAIVIDSVSGGPNPFPDLETRLTYVNARVSFAWSESLDVGVLLRYQQFEAEDWALQGVQPATIPQVLSLGAEPWDEDQTMFGLSFRYVVGDDD